MNTNVGDGHKVILWLSMKHPESSKNKISEKQQQQQQQSTQEISRGLRNEK